MTPKELRKIIDEEKSHWLRTYQRFEKYEAMLAARPDLKFIPGTNTPVEEDLEYFRDRLRTQSATSRKYAKLLEEALARDEAENGWKGEDRIIDLNVKEE